MIAPIIKTALITKSHFAGALIASVTGFIGAESQNFSMPIVALVTVSSGAVGAFFASLPKLVTARATAAQAALEFSSGETQKLIERVHQSYARQVAAGNRRVHLHQQISEIQRQAKHNAMGEVQRITWRLREVETMLTRAGVNPEPFALKTYHELAGDQDAEIQRLLSTAQLEEIE